MIFHELRASNFLSWENMHVPLRGQGLVYLTGANGSGKSSIFDAIQWCLYGKISRKLSADEVVNRRAKKNCSVTLQIEVNKEQYRVYRYRKHSSYGDRLELLSSKGADLSCETKPQTQERLIRLIGLSHEAFLNTVVMEQGARKYFAAFTDAEQKSVLEDVLGLKIFSTCQSLVRDKEKELAGRLIELEESVAVLKRDFHDACLQLSTKQSKQRSSLRYAEERLEHVRSELQTINRSIKEEERRRTHYHDRYNRFEDLRHRTSTAIKEGKDLVSCSKSLIGRRCPTCERPITKNDYKSVYDRYKSRFDGLKVTLDTACERLKHVGIALEQAGQTLDRKSIQRDELIREEATIKTELRVDKSVDDKSEVDRLRKSLRKRRESLIECQKLVAWYEFWSDGFGNRGLKSLLLRRVVPTLNSRTNYYLSFLSEMRIKFSIDGDKLSMELKYPGGGNRYGGISGGERRRADLAVNLALQDVVVQQVQSSTNLLMLDEIVENLDERGVEGVVQLLNSLKKDTIIAVSHRQSLREFFPTVWTVKKRGGFSELEYLNKNR